MIGGADVILEYPGVLRASGGLDIAARHFASRWPVAVFQDGASGQIFTTYSSIPFGRLTEMFIYRDARAGRSWGRTPATRTPWCTSLPTKPRSL
jgi:hypothetical protein